MVEDRSDGEKRFMIERKDFLPRGGSFNSSVPCCWWKIAGKTSKVFTNIL
jgi:hypothetical protein